MGDLGQVPMFDLDMLYSHLSDSHLIFVLSCIQQHLYHYPNNKNTQ
jgi:hypothetical protein